MALYDIGPKRTPVAHYWDMGEPKMLAVQADRVCGPRQYSTVSSCCCHAPWKRLLAPVVCGVLSLAMPGSLSSLYGFVAKTHAREPTPCVWWCRHVHQVNVPSGNEAKGSLESKEGEDGSSSKLHKSDLEDVPVEVGIRMVGFSWGGVSCPAHHRSCFRRSTRAHGVTCETTWAEVA